MLKPYSLMGKSYSVSQDQVLSFHEKSSLLFTEVKNRRTLVHQKMCERVIRHPPKTPVHYFKFSHLPNTIFLMILSFLANELRTLLSISAFFNFKILETFDDNFSLLESNFAYLHSYLFSLKKTFISTGQVSTSKFKGYRIDRIIVSEVLPELVNHTITVSYTFQTYMSNEIFTAEYKFDCVHKGKKMVWVHKDQTKSLAFGSKAFTAQIPQIVIGNNIEFAVNWYNPQYLTKISSIKFRKPVIEPTGNIMKSLSVLKNEPCNYYLLGQRTPEPELMQEYWYLPEFYHKAVPEFDFSEFEPFLSCSKVELSGTDCLFFKVEFQAKKSGLVGNSYKRLGIGIEVKSDKKETTNEIKRFGLMYDRQKSIEIHLGDKLLVYISK